MKAIAMSRTLCAMVAIGTIVFAQAPQARSITADQKKLNVAKQAYLKSKTAFEKKPKDAGLKKSHISVAMNYANTALYSSALTPQQKYPLSLRLYREVLKLDPKNSKAKENKDLIEGIYRQMGRPIPK